MPRRLGENLQREWDAEPRAAELWNALQSRKRDGNAGLAMLVDLAATGSSLAMMYLGHAYAKEGGSSSDEVLGEQLLSKSAHAGSIEGRVQLAILYQRQERWAEVERELKALALQSYSPAMQALACLLYEGSFGHRSVAEAVYYFKQAASAGHIFSKGRLAWICRKERLGFRESVISQWSCVKSAPRSLWYILTYSTSDRLRQI